MHGDATRRRRHLTALYRSYSPSARRLCPHCASETTPHTDTPRLRLNQMCACNCAAVVSRCVCWGGGEMRKWAHWRRQMLACTANVSLGGAGCRDDGKKQTACYGGVGETQQAHAPDGCAEDTCARGRQQQHHCGSAAHARLRAPGHCLSRRSSARRMEQGQGQLGQADRGRPRKERPRSQELREGYLATKEGQPTAQQGQGLPGERRVHRRDLEGCEGEVRRRGCEALQLPDGGEGEYEAGD